MAGLGGLKPTDRAKADKPTAGLTAAQQAFIDAAPSKSAPTPKPPVARKSVRTNLSLDAQTIALVARMELEPKGFKITRSAVVRAAIKAFSNLPEAQRVEILRLLVIEEQGE
jgi:hypothetical protein